MTSGIKRTEAVNKRHPGVKHRVTTRCAGVKPPETIYRNLIKQAVYMTLKSENADIPCVVNVLITDDKGIRSYNKKYRGIDKATDVLSFPMQEFEKAGWAGMMQPDMDPDTQTLPLGDIIISSDTIKRHARKYKVTVEQETTRMIIHSSLHLLGYDHGGPMEEKEESLMHSMGYFLVPVSDGFFIK